MLNLISVSSKAQASEVLADMCFAKLSGALSERGKATLLLSGGSTPGPAYEQLGKFHLNWEGVIVGLVDERWVEANHEASNEGLVRRTLMAGKAQECDFLPMKHEGSLAEAMPRLNESYEPFAATDVVVLGMGPDGHTASWFPGADGLEASMDANGHELVAPIIADNAPVAGKYPERATVTMPALKNARHVFLMISGEDKMEVLADTQRNLPIHQLFEARNQNITTIWIK